jgi:hypothetical protein
LTFTGFVTGYTLTACSNQSSYGPQSFSTTLNAGNTVAFTELVAVPPADWESAKVTTLTVNGQAITASPQNVVVGSSTYTINGFGNCFSA